MSWLEKLRADALKSEEWANLYHSLINRINNKLPSLQLKLFADLNPAEQQILLDEIELELHTNSREYHNFSQSLAGTLDETLNLSSTKTVNGDSFVKTVGRHPDANILLSMLGEAATELLQKWPDRLSELRIAAASGLPSGLRRYIWTARLVNLEARAEFEHRLAGEGAAGGAGGGRLAVTSRRDAEIAAACRAALDGELAGQVSVDHFLAIKVSRSWHYSQRNPGLRRSERISKLLLGTHTFAA